MTVAPKLYENQVFLDVFDSQGQHQRLLVEDVESPVVFKEYDDATQLQSSLGAPPNSFDGFESKEPHTGSTLNLLLAKLPKVSNAKLSVRVEESVIENEWLPIRLDRRKGRAGFFRDFR
jgi:hypothetical protein